MTYPTISELEKRIEQLETSAFQDLLTFKEIAWKFAQTFDEQSALIEGLKNHNQFLAKRLDAQASRIAVLEGHPKNYEKTVEG